MSKKVSWQLTDQNITVNYDGQTHIVSRTDALAERLIKALKEKKEDEIPSLVSAAKRVELFSHGNFVVQDGRILVNGVEAPEVLSQKIIKFSNEGLPYQPLVKFAERLQLNPSFRAVQELFTFLEKNDHPITESGNFIAYKRVRGTFMDIHSNTMDNSPGTLVQMPRNQVNEDSNQTCSYGLHVANWDYAHNHFASSDSATDVMLEVEVDPADVVAIPVDYNNAKMRVCKYKVLGVVDKEHSSETQLRVTSTPVYNGEFVDEELDACTICGADCEEGYDLCIDCEAEQEEESSSSSDDFDADETDEENDGDTYPWEDELK
jgi:hypothetical protein